MNFGELSAAVLGDVKRDHFRQRFGVAMHAPEAVAAFGLGRPAPAGADRIDQHQIGEGEPGVRVVGQTDVGAVVVVAERSNARTDQAEIEERRAGARSAVEHERHRPCRAVRFRNEGCIENGGRALARLIEQRQRTGGRRVSELAGRRVDAVLGDGIRRQQRQDARAGLARALLLMVRPLIAAVAAVLLRDRGRGDKR